jgi:transcriptional regulator of acetoin/glycerol metabolism
VAGITDSHHSTSRSVRAAPTHDDIRAALTEAGERRAEARRAQQDAMIDIADWRRGHRILSVAEMARLSGVTRETIYRTLR